MANTTATWGIITIMVMVITTMITAMATITTITENKSGAAQQALDRLLPILNSDECSLLWDLCAASPVDEIRRWVAGHPAAPKDHLLRLTKDKSHKVLDTLLDRLSGSDRARALKAIASRTGDAVWVLCKVTKCPDLLEVMSGSKAPFIRGEVAKNSKTPVHTLEVLARDAEKSVRWEVAENVCVPPALLNILAADPELGVRQVVARSACAPIAALEVLAVASDEGTRKLVARNAVTPPELLEKLCRDPSQEVRLAVARSHSSPSSCLQELAKDLDVSVRQSVASNISAPAELLDELSRDPDASIRQAVAANTQALPESLEFLSKDPDLSVRTSVARSAATPIGALEVLSKDPQLQIRQVVAWNTAVPLAILSVLSEDPDASVQRIVAMNPNATPEMVLSLIRKHVGAQWRSGLARRSDAKPVLRELALDPEIDVRLAVAQNPNTPVETLFALANDMHDRTVRLLACTNPSVSPELLDRYLAPGLDALRASIGRLLNERRGAPLPEIPDMELPDFMRGLRWLGLNDPTSDNKTLTKASRSKDWLTRLATALNPKATEGILGLLAQDADPDVARAAKLPRKAVQEALQR